MLDQQTIKVIQSTVPVLKEYGTAITSRFYQRLFEAHPELLNLFNHANQKQGRQQGALANAVYAAAVHIEKLETILPAVRHIAHKHRSLGVKPEQYPVVGQHLLGAIKEVLEDAATDEILEAWGKAYGVIADVFISVEHSMYEEAEGQVGGWSGFRAFVVEKKVVESDVITSFYLRPQDGGPIAVFEPGQYVSVRMVVDGDEHTQLRQYSLSDSPGKPYYRISVKREDALGERPEGMVSSNLHADVSVGEVLMLSAPAGAFKLDVTHNRPVMLLSGGVGLTPMVSMANTLAERQPDRRTVFVHAARDGNLHAMRESVLELQNQAPGLSVYYCYMEPTGEDRALSRFDHEGIIDAAWLERLLPGPDVDVYLCGPVPFMKAMFAALQAIGVTESQIHYEFFGPTGSLGQ
ncbi:NO-inducible flavohemoprotein [Paenibacillus sp. strain BS8-2]